MFVIAALIAARAFFSMAELSLAAARRVKLRQTPTLARAASGLFTPETAATLGFVASFVLVGPMDTLTRLLKPLAWVFDRAADALFTLFGLQGTRDDRVTHDDILAMAEAPAASDQARPSSSTSNSSVAFGGITPPAPRAP